MTTAKAADPQEKLYHTRMLNSTFIAQLHDKDGKPMQGQTATLHFRGKDLRTSNPEFIAQLDACADKPGSMIYTTDKPRIQPEELIPSQEVRQRASDIVAQIAASGARV